MTVKDTIGDLRYRVEIQTATYTSDSRGGHSESWSTTDYRWADIRPLAGREFLFAEIEGRKITHRIIMRTITLDAQKQRIKFGDRIFKIQYPRDPLPGNMRGYVEIMVVE